jgi:hypothetical protein
MKITEMKNEVIKLIPEAEKFFNDPNLEENKILAGIAGLGQIKNNFHSLADLGIFEFKKDVVNRHDCFNCAFKHLGEAAVIIEEMLNGYYNETYEVFLIGHLALAQRHLAFIDVSLSNAVRDFRVDIFETTNRIDEAVYKACLELSVKVMLSRSTPRLTIIKRTPENKKQTGLPCGTCGSSKRHDVAGGRNE